jgi:Zn-dependent protease
MQAQIRLGRIFGIEIGLHYSWLIIAVLIATSLAGHFSEAYPDWAATIIWTTAIMTALLFFAAIIVHELSHAAIARLEASLYVRSHFLLSVASLRLARKLRTRRPSLGWASLARSRAH